MALGLIILPAIAGYWFVTHWNYTRFNAVRETGYHVLFRSAFTGAVFFWLAYFVTQGIQQLIDTEDRFWEIVPTDSVEAMLTFAFGVVSPLVLNRFYDEQSGARKAAIGSGDKIELLIAESIQQTRTIELSLKNRKVYVGWALDSGIGLSGQGDIPIIPILSGYRDERTLRLVFTTDYGKVLSPSPMDGNLQVVVPMSEIAHVRWFDVDTYKRFPEPTAGSVISSVQQGAI